MLKRFPSTRLVLLSNKGESVRERQGDVAGEWKRENKRKKEHRERERERKRETECTEISLHPWWLLKLRDEQPQKSGK